MIRTTSASPEPARCLQGRDVAGVHDVEAAAGGDQGPAAGRAAAGASPASRSVAAVVVGDRLVRQRTGWHLGTIREAASHRPDPRDASRTPSAAASDVRSPTASGTAAMAAKRSPAPQESPPGNDRAPAGNADSTVVVARKAPADPAVTQTRPRTRRRAAARQQVRLGRAGRGPPAAAAPFSARAAAVASDEVGRDQGGPANRLPAAGVRIPDHPVRDAASVSRSRSRRVRGGARAVVGDQHGVRGGRAPRRSVRPGDRVGGPGPPSSIRSRDCPPLRTLVLRRVGPWCPTAISSTCGSSSARRRAPPASSAIGATSVTRAAGAGREESGKACAARVSRAAS